MQFSETISISFSIGVGVLTLMGLVFFSAFLINRFGRRPLLLWSHLGVLACNYILLALQLTHDVCSLCDINLVKFCSLAVHA